MSCGTGAELPDVRPVIRAFDVCAVGAQFGRLVLGVRWSIPSTSKGKVKVKFTLEQATKAQRWSRGIALLVL